MTDELPPHKQWPSAWCNDTLSGKLGAWVRPEDHEGDDPPYGKLGYWRSVERRMVRAEFEACHGRAPTYMEESKAIDANHRADATFAEICAARSARSPAPVPLAFTREQLARLVELHAGANDPVTLSIAQVAQALLDAMGPAEPS